MSDSKKAQLAILMQLARRNANIASLCVEASKALQADDTTNADTTIEEILNQYAEAVSEIRAVRNIIADHRSSTVVKKQRDMAAGQSRVMAKSFADMRGGSWGWSDDDLRRVPPISGKRKDADLPLDQQDPVDVIGQFKDKN